MKYYEIIKIIKQGAVVVKKTDTLYGIIASADIPEAVERIYQLKERSQEKPFIVLLSHMRDLKRFSPVLNSRMLRVLEEKWPGKTSIIIPLGDESRQKFFYIHRGFGSIAFRIPQDKELRDFLSLTGPVVAPSANKEGFPPAKSIEEAFEYFGADISYFDEGVCENEKPSELISIDSFGNIEIIRSI